jgi:hypothetical protein
LYPDTKLPHYNINLSQWIKYFSQDVMNTKEGITYKGEYTKRTENGELFQADGVLNPQEIALSKIDKLVLADGILIVDYSSKHHQTILT